MIREFLVYFCYLVFLDFEKKNCSLNLEDLYCCGDIEEFDRFELDV